MGSEKAGCSPFLDYPIWKINWEQYVVDYEEKSRSNLLLSHLDQDAKKRIAGAENDYVKAMDKLDKYFGDKRKVVRDCMAEVTNFGIVPHNNLKQLIALKTWNLEMNFARLSSCDLQGEMNNMSCMKIIQSKFPPAQQLEWTKHLEELLGERVADPFTEFMV